jgi:hypothetical protein
LPGVDTALFDALTEAGLASPAAVADAGVEKLRALEAVGERATALHQAAADWVTAHAPVPEPEPEEPEGEGETDGEAGADAAPAVKAADAHDASAPE